jgi:glycosyltransferase involved in cell wall biosynthesis
MKKENVERVLVVTSGWPSEKCPYAGVFVFRQVQSLRKLGLQIDVLNFRGQMNPLRYWRAYLKLNRQVKANNYDLIHAHFGQAGFLAVLQKKCPVVVTFHGSDIYGLAQRSLQSRLKSMALKRCSILAAKKADAVIAVSQKLAKKMEYPAHVISTGVDLSLFRFYSQVEARELLRLPFDEKIILFVGNPANSIKRYSLACQAVSLLSHEIPNVRLRVCHNVSPEDMPNYFNAADVLVVASSHEGACMIVIEALACNLPVVSVDVGHVRDYIESIKGCFICNDDSPETIAEALREAIRYKGRVNGRDKVQDLSETVVAKKVYNVYKKVVLMDGGAKLN